MIKLVGSSKEEPKYSITYDQSARVLDIELSAMCDDCTPYEESTGCMVWLDKNKAMCEIECIFPVMAEGTGDWIGHAVSSQRATPKLEVRYEEKPVEVVFDHEQLILILNKERMVDKKYVSSNITFCVSGDELVALICTDFDVI